MIPLLIYGASGHAKVAADIVQLCGTYSIAAFIDELHPERSGEAFCGARVEDASILDTAASLGIRHVFVAVGDCDARLRLFERFDSAGFLQPNLVHPAAVVAASAALSHGILVAAGAVVGAGAVLGEAVIVNTSASVDHDCNIRRGAHISPGAHLGGNVTVGSRTWIGIGASVRHAITIGSGSVLGAGAVLLRDIPDGVVAFGNPARIVKDRE